MFDAFTQLVEPAFEFIITQFLIVLTYPFSPKQRIFWLYLCSSSVLACYVFYISCKLDSALKPSVRAFVRFLFPTEVWRQSSAWLDVRYFFFHQIFRFVIYGTFLAGVLNLTFELITDGASSAGGSKLTTESNIADIAISTVYMFVLVAFVDLAAYGIHYLQHKVPILWEFHKVHHSLEVMHPLSNYREHPIDNIVYAVGTGMAYGLLMGVASNLFGYLPDMPSLLGIPFLVFAFNILGYNLRHSHVWLRWPGRWSMLFASPAHHHIHHSYHPDHIDTNFAFMFPFWDVLFGTYHLPETNKDVRFGLSGQPAIEYKSCLGIYFMPIRSALAPTSNRLERVLKELAIRFRSQR